MTTPQLEKVYFNYILKNKKYFEIVNYFCLMINSPKTSIRPTSF